MGLPSDGGNHDHDDDELAIGDFLNASDDVSDHMWSCSAPAQRTMPPASNARLSTMCDRAR